MKTKSKIDETVDEMLVDLTNACEDSQKKLSKAAARAIKALGPTHPHVVQLADTHVHMRNTWESTIQLLAKFKAPRHRDDDEGDEWKKAKA